jgi:hypothetical protein
MISNIPINVECHSGYKADEYPKCFFHNNKRFEIIHISDRWYQSDAIHEFPVSDYFKVETAGGEQFILKHEIEDDKWYLRV